MGIHILPILFRQSRQSPRLSKSSTLEKMAAKSVMILFAALVALAYLSGAHAACNPSDAMACVRDLQRVSGTATMSQVCSKANTALDCLDGVVTRCLTGTSRQRQMARILRMQISSQRS